MKLYTFYTLTIFRFTEIINTGDLTILVKKGEVTDSFEVQNKWESIFYKFVDEINDVKTKNKLDVISDVKELELEMNILKNTVILYRLSDDKDKSLLNQLLAKYSKNINVNEDAEPQLKVIENYCAALITKIAQIKLNNKKTFKKAEEDIKQNVFNESATMHKVLGIDVNPMKTILPQWIAYRNLLSKQAA